jgi:hypothetical protein
MLMGDSQREAVRGKWPLIADTTRSTPMAMPLVV